MKMPYISRWWVSLILFLFCSLSHTGYSDTRQDCLSIEPLPKLGNECTQSKFYDLPPYKILSAHQMADQFSSISNVNSASWMRILLLTSILPLAAGVIGAIILWEILMQVRPLGPRLRLIALSGPIALSILSWGSFFALVLVVLRAS